MTPTSHRWDAARTTGTLRARRARGPVAGALALALATGGAAGASPAPAGIEGSVVFSGASSTPSAKVWVRSIAEPSEPRADDVETGRFTIPDLPPGVYRIAVESEGALFPAGDTVTLAPAERLKVAIVVPDRTVASARTGSGAAEASGGSKIWSSPTLSSLVIAGSAIVLGVALREWTDDEEPDASPSTP